MVNGPWAYMADSVSVLDLDMVLIPSRLDPSDYITRKTAYDQLQALPPNEVSMKEPMKDVSLTEHPREYQQSLGKQCLSQNHETQASLISELHRVINIVDLVLSGAPISFP